LLCHSHIVMGPDQIFWHFWPGLGQPSLVWVWKISPQNTKFFNFFPFGSKKISSGRVKKTGQPLIYCGSKVCSGQARAHPYSHILMHRSHSQLQHCTHLWEENGKHLLAITFLSSTFFLNKIQPLVWLLGYCKFS